MAKAQSDPPSVTVEVTPYGVMQVYTQDFESDLLSDLQQRWAELWPAIRMKLEEMCSRYEISQRLKTTDWVAAIQRMQPDVFMGDKADFLFSLKLGETYPEWDFFLKGSTIVHAQPIK